MDRESLSFESLVYDKGVTVEYDKHDRYRRIVGKVLVNPQTEIWSNGWFYLYYVQPFSCEGYAENWKVIKGP